jgi:hypothetical protein
VGYWIISNLYSAEASPYLGRLLSLASVKYIIYPHYDFFISYRDFIPEMTSNITIEGFKNYKPIIDKNVAIQKEWYLLNGFRTVDIFENNHFRPQIYAVSDIP